MDEQRIQYLIELHIRSERQKLAALIRETANESKSNLEVESAFDNLASKLENCDE